MAKGKNNRNTNRPQNSAPNDVTKVKALNFTVPSALHFKLKKEAASLGISVSALIRVILSERYEK